MKKKERMIGVYQAHGEFCANHPWEVIVATFTITACIFFIDSTPSIHTFPQEICESGVCQETNNGLDILAMAIIRCLALLYCYYQFCSLNKLGSKYILGIAGLFTIFASFVFSSSVINCLSGDLSDLKDALFFFLLQIDLSKATLLAQFALSGSTQDEIKKNIARGMALIGPSLTLDTIVETLVISIGTLSGIRRLETLCYFASMSVVVNYIVFMTFYPSCLSLVLELTNYSKLCNISNGACIIPNSQYKDGQKRNPVLQRVKLIMATGLVFVHLHCRWLEKAENNRSHNVIPFLNENDINSNYTNDETLVRWIAVSSDHVIILVLLFGLTVKFIFFEDGEEMASENIFQLEETKKSKSYTQNEDSCRNKPILSNKSVQTDRYKPKYALSDMLPTDTSQSDADLSPNDYSQSDTDMEELEEPDSETIRSFEECIDIYKNECFADKLNDREIELLTEKGIIQAYQLEKVVANPERGVKIRRNILSNNVEVKDAFTNLPYQHYDYSKVMGACCENVVGYIPIPVGIAGPLFLDNQMIYVPMATTEGCLVASTNRGCRALLKCGVTSRVVGDGMTRGPVVRFNSIKRASEAMLWMQTDENFVHIKECFDSTSRFARLTRIHVRIAGRYLFIRFVATTGDAMGMNMVSKGTEIALNFVQQTFPDMDILSLSGNFCADKKPAAVNWIEGRGKYVVCEAIVKAGVIETILKTTAHALVDVNINKNLVGSAVAGSIGGFNAHAANIVTAIFIATGQDPAQNVGSSNCMTLMEPWGDGNDLYVSCTMPSIEIGTVGGGTHLNAQSACLDLLGVRGANELSPGENANRLARIVCGSVLAGELSLLSALAAGHLVRSHLKHNRSTANVSSLLQQSRTLPCLGLSSFK